MQVVIFFMQVLREIVVEAITSRLAEPLGKGWIWLTSTPGHEFNRPPNPVNWRSISLALSE